jgi:hypothetical protein
MIHSPLWNLASDHAYHNGTLRSLLDQHPVGWKQVLIDGFLDGQRRRVKDFNSGIHPEQLREFQTN